MKTKQKKNLFTVNLFDKSFSEPGLYQIRCLKNGRIYIGESECCLYRLGGHLKDLRNRRHHCLPLQKDFLLYGICFFEATIIDFGNQWQSQEKRKKEEKKLVSLVNEQKIYNFDKSFEEKPCFTNLQYDGQVFLTVKALREYYNEKGLKNQTLVKPISDTTFRRNFLSPYGKNYGEISFEINFVKKIEKKKLLTSFVDNKKAYNFDENFKEKPCYKSFQYDDQVFLTIKALREYYNEKGLKNQTLVRPLSESTFRRDFISPYGKNYGEITFVKVTKQLQQYCVKGEICNGLEEIVEKGFAKNKRQAVYRLSSSKWPDYQYIKKVQVAKNRRKISINGVLYTTEEIIEKGLAENREVIYARLRSQSFSWKDWFWVDKPKKS
uniref:Putative GIY-YIG homing endonuclease n=1 Tax=Rhexinema sarcinoideum TaxID=43261 RepID=A0A1B2RYS2_9CHLO|nr:putative GIY-YIG homing endonuclease [Rhexinema sarcinoideum]